MSTIHIESKGYVSFSYQLKLNYFDDLANFELFCRSIGNLGTLRNTNLEFVKAKVKIVALLLFLPCTCSLTLI